MLINLLFFIGGFLSAILMIGLGINSLLKDINKNYFK